MQLSRATRGELAAGASRLPTRVVAAVIRDDAGAVLLSLRPQHVAHGGLWEFPGGKLSAGERPIDGLARELQEELGIHIKCAMPLIRVLHHYPNKQIDLAVFEVRAWRGAPHGCEGQEIRWVRGEQLAGLEFPAANLPVKVALELPRLALVTPAIGGSENAFLTRLERCLDAGIRLVQLRLLEQDAPIRRRVSSQAVTLCERYGARLLLNGVVGEAVALGAHGAHLNSRRLLQLGARPLAPAFMLSAACHNVAELAHAERIGVDFAYVSPVHATPSHPAATTLGWHGLQQLVRRARLPVFALGGLAATDLRLALRAGCQGIAMMSGLWESADPRAVLQAAAAAAAAAAYRVSAEN